MTERTRCDWCLSAEDYIEYHDREWGVPCYDDGKQFEFLILEAAQAGLSWLTVLRKREGYRNAFAHFNAEAVAAFSDAEIEALITNPAIIRNKLKISAAVNNARHFLEVQQEFGTFSKYIWSFVGDKPIVNHWETIKDVPATSAESDVLSKDLKKRGFKFVGSTIIYAHMQACGLVNDHLISCHRHREVQKIRS